MVEAGLNGWDSFDKFRRWADVMAMVDLVAFGFGGVYVAYRMGAASLAVGWCSKNGLFLVIGRASTYIHASHVNGDGRADIIGFSSGVYVSVSVSTRNSIHLRSAMVVTICVVVLRPIPSRRRRDQPGGLVVRYQRASSISVLCTGTCQAKRLPGDAAPMTPSNGTFPATDGAACRSGSICNVCADHDSTVPDVTVRTRCSSWCEYAELPRHLQTSSEMSKRRKCRVRTRRHRPMGPTVMHIRSPKLRHVP